MNSYILLKTKFKKKNLKLVGKYIEKKEENMIDEDGLLWLTMNALLFNFEIIFFFQITGKIAGKNDFI